MNRFAIGALGALFVCTSSIASAATLVDQSTFGTGFSPYSIGNGQRLASSFVLSSPATITTATWYGFGDTSASFGVQFFDNASGIPGSLLYTTSGSATKSASYTADSMSNQVYQFDMTLPTSFIAAANTYFFSVYDFASPSGSFRWKDGVFQTGAMGNGGSTSTNSTGWGIYGSQSYGSYAFKLGGDGASVTDAVPEPATWALILVGFGGLGAAMRRQRRKQALAAI